MAKVKNRRTHKFTAASNGATRCNGEPFTFAVLEKWSNTLFERLQQEPPQGYKYVSHEQLLRADKALWLKVAEDIRSNVQSKGDIKPWM